jgi:hypothetical protein
LSGVHLDTDAEDLVAGAGVGMGGWPTMPDDLVSPIVRVPASPAPPRR